MPVPTTFNAVPKRTLLRDQVHDTLRSAILDGTLEPGERLHDEALIAWLGSSRTPIRDALVALAHEGLVDMIPNRSSRVARPTAAEQRSTLQALGVVIGGIVRVTIPVLTAQQKKTAANRLTTEIERLRAGMRARDARAGADAYQSWLRLCPNPLLAAIGQRAVQGLAFKLRVDTGEDIVSTGHLIEHLTALRDAILTGDCIAAEHAIKAAHLLDDSETAVLADAS